MRPSHGQNGFALLLVLWALVMITLLATQLTAAGHRETLIAANLRTAAQLEALADGQIYEAIYRLMDPSPEGWRPGGGDRKQSLGGAEAQVRIFDESGKLNPSIATPEMLQALMREVGIPSTTAAGLATAIVQWRTPSGNQDINSLRFTAYRAAGRIFGPSGASFLSLDELGAVIGMTPEWLARLAPHLSLFTEGDPDPNLADPVLRQALASVDRGAFAPRADAQQMEVVTITAMISASGGTGFTRRATVRLARNGAQRDYRILSWEAPGRG